MNNENILMTVRDPILMNVTQNIQLVILESHYESTISVFSFTLAKCLHSSKKTLITSNPLDYIYLLATGGILQVRGV